MNIFTKLFKRETAPITPRLKCPEEGCDVTCLTKYDLKRHLEWKHSKTNISAEQLSRGA